MDKIWAVLIAVFAIWFILCFIYTIILEPLLEIVKDFGMKGILASIGFFLALFILVYISFNIDITLDPRFMKLLKYLGNLFEWIVGIGIAGVFFYCLLTNDDDPKK